MYRVQLSTYVRNIINIFCNRLIINQMNIKISLILGILIVIAHSSFNTTQFWRKSLNLTEDIHFQSYAGMQEIDWYHPRGSSGMHYQIFGAMGHDVSTPSSNVPLIIWLQGGPGGSSLFGSFTQLGPIRIVQGKPKLFQYPWNIFGHNVFIDQPLNVGFSYYGNRTSTKQVSSARQAATHLLNFLHNFYNEWPSLRVSPLYITGESYAGHYVPAFATAIILNQTFRNTTKVVLKGVAIGDGWVDPINQYNFYDSLLYSAGIVSNKFRDVCTWVQTQGLLNIYNGQYTNATMFWDYLTNNGTVWDTYMGGMNEFNFRVYNDDGDSSFINFLQSNKGSFGVPVEVDYIPGSQQVYENFHHDISVSYSSDIVILLRNIKVLLYNGQDDYVVNTAGVLNYINSLQWDSIANWKRARKEVWTINNEIKGWAKTYGNLWFVLVNRAGHLVPTDQPESAFSMLGHFINNDRNWKG